MKRDMKYKIFFSLTVALCLSLTAMSSARAQEQVVDPAAAQAIASDVAPANSVSADPSAAAPAVPTPITAGAGAAAQPTSDVYVGGEKSSVERDMEERISLLKPSVNIDAMRPVLLTPSEHDLIRDARRGLNTRSPLNEDSVKDTARDLSLGGIVYVSSKDWTLWLNGMRVTPKAIPSQVMDLKVHKDYIELEWFDSGTNQIFPIRLRAHERFNLDTRIFLPG